MIANIQILRALAATAVVFYHTGYRVPGLLHTDFLGVAVFFVISGFIMSHIARESAGTFMMHRIMRIVPLYWLATFFYATVIWMGTSSKTATAVSLAEDLLFVPRFSEGGTPIEPALGVGWTLNLEMFFYLMFALALAANRGLAPIIVAAFLSTLWSIARAYDLGPLLSFWAHDYTIYFVFGIAVFYLWDKALPRSSALGWLLVLCGAILIITFSFDGSAIAAKAGPPLLVLGAVALETSGYRCRTRFPLLLGAASYALYLFHPFAIGLAKAAADPSSGIAIALSVTTASVFLALAIHLLIEQKMTKAIRRYGSSRTLNPAASAVRDEKSAQTRLQ
jgi:exopolysaccharide production protein ExoZ